MNILLIVNIAHRSSLNVSAFKTIKKNQFLAVEKLKNENLRRFWPYAVTWEEGFSVARNGAHRYDGLSGVGNICHSAPNF